MKLYGAIDLHSRNNYLAVTDGNDKRLYGKRLPNRLDVVFDALEPFKENLTGIVVESTFNWYWLVDGLQEEGHRVHLANPSAIKQYEGLKHSDDEWDSFWLCHLLRLDILPTGYIYPKETRPVRDLLRRRVLFVRHRTSLILSTQSMIERVVGKHLSTKEINKLDWPAIEQLFHQPQLELAVRSNIAAIQFYNKQIKEIEKEVLDQVKLRDDFNMLLTIPGIGKILGLTIMLEVGDIGAVCHGRRLLFVLSVRQRGATEQWEKERRKQSQKRQQISVLGLRRGGPLCPAILCGSADVLSTKAGKKK